MLSLYRDRCATEFFGQCAIILKRSLDDAVALVVGFLGFRLTDAFASGFFLCPCFGFVGKGVLLVDRHDVIGFQRVRLAVLPMMQP